MNIQPVDDRTAMIDVTPPSDLSTIPIPRSKFLRLTFSSDAPSGKLRVENLHYELTEEDLDVRTSRELAT